jgi:rod shape-determining protein MreC
MQQLIYFLRKFKNFLFFLSLQFIAVALTFNNLNFHKSKFVNSANFIIGSLYEQSSNISSYIHLKSENELLVEENVKLKNLLEKSSTFISNEDLVVIDTLNSYQKYSYTKAKIIKNEFSKPFNFLLVNKGEDQGIDKEMAVINSNGIIGIIDDSKSKYARVQSILNRNSKINARLKNSPYFGTLKWDEQNYNIVQLLDIPRQAVLKIGDTIETGGMSTIFPEGILIGAIIKISQENSIDNKIDIKLFNDMSSLSAVYIIKSLDKKEIKSLEIIGDE